MNKKTLISVATFDPVILAAEAVLRAAGLEPTPVDRCPEPTCAACAAAAVGASTVPPGSVRAA
jgi:hypothetical protein